MARIEAVRKELDISEKKLNEADARYTALLSKQRVDWAKEKEVHESEIAALKGEIETLKKQREPLLIPIELDKKKAHDLLVEAEQVLSQSRAKKDELADLEEALQAKIDDYTDREEDFKQREAELKVRISTVAEQKASVDKMSKLLTDEWNKFFNEKEAWYAVKDHENNDLNIRRINLEERERLVAERHIAQNERERGINDKYATLLRTINRNKK